MIKQFTTFIKMKCLAVIKKTIWNEVINKSIYMDFISSSDFDRVYFRPIGIVYTLEHDTGRWW